MLEYNEYGREDGDNEDTKCDFDDLADGIDNDSDSSSVANYLKNQLHNYRSNAVDGMIEASEPIYIDNIEGIKSKLESNNIPLIWKSLQQLVSEFPLERKREKNPNF